MALATSNRHKTQGFGYAKALIFGEYAVLHGAPGLVVALDRRVNAAILPGDDAPDEFCRNIARHTHVPAGSHVEFDNECFFDAERRKLGIGSSAAAITASLHAAALDAGRPFGTPEDVMSAIGAHRAFQGNVGSGADIIASVLGGVCLVRGCPEAPEVRRVPANALPPFRLIALHEDAPTAVFVKSAEEQAGNADYESALARLTSADERLADLVLSWSETVPDDEYMASFLEQVDAMVPLLADFQTAIHKTILTPRFFRLRDRARPLGIVIKSSGAGGGDICLAFSCSADALDRFCQSLGDPEADPIDVRIAEPRPYPLTWCPHDDDWHAPPAPNDAEQVSTAARTFEKQLARMYLEATLFAATVTIAGATFVLLRFGWNANALIQSFGFLLFGFLIGMALLHIQRKHHVDALWTACVTQNIHPDALKHHIMSRPEEFILARNALCDPVAGDNRTPSPDARDGTDATSEPDHDHHH